MTHPHQPHRGLALPVVLWILLLITVMATSYSYSVRTETAMTQQLIAATRARAAAEAGVQGAINRLLTSKKTDLSSSTGQVYDEDFEAIQLRVAVLNVSGRIDLNKASEGLLEAMLQAHLSADDAPEDLVQAILDWRDSDSDRRPLGAEEEDYRDAGLAYGPANAPFSRVDELALVLGMTPDLFASMRGLVTVHSGSAGINPALAPREVLLILPGQSEQSVDLYLEERTAEGSIKNVRLLGDTPTAFLSKKTGKIYSIEVEARMESGARNRLSTIINLSDGPTRPYTVLSWKEVESLRLIH